MAANQQPRKTGSDTQNKAILVGSGFIAGLVVGVVIMNFTGVRHHRRLGRLRRPGADHRRPAAGAGPHQALAATSRSSRTS